MLLEPASPPVRSPFKWCALLGVCSCLPPLAWSLFALAAGDTCHQGDNSRPPSPPLAPPQRLYARYQTDKQRFAVLYEIVTDEVARKDADHGGSCTKGLLWLKR